MSKRRNMFQKNKTQETTENEDGWWPLFKPSQILYSEFPEHRSQNRRAYDDLLGGNTDLDASSSRQAVEGLDSGWVVTNSLEDSNWNSGDRSKRMRQRQLPVMATPPYPVISSPIQKRYKPTNDQRGPWRSLVAVTEVRPQPVPMKGYGRTRFRWSAPQPLPSSSSMIVRKFRPAKKIYYW
ncbi:hypothetical protein AAG570_012029 [Ranatra chinensis]|uniref:Uncharacterized protein n=1 Tax=Ranatra chinensis TaxID=642074 RepID=A0ABD0YHM7_9HEMI